jgi:hypothetical protein
LGPGRRRLGGVGKPNHDAFWAYRASLAAFICRGNGQALDVGCGEGRVSREFDGMRLPGDRGRSRQPVRQGCHRSPIRSELHGGISD